MGSLIVAAESDEVSLAELNLNFLFNDRSSFAFSRSERFLDNGTTYQESYSLLYGDWKLTFFGSDLTIDGAGALTGGTVFGFVDYSFDGIKYHETTRLVGTGIAAVDLSAAMASVDISDDLDLTRRLLSGDDYMYLSDRELGDKFSGFDGNDRIYGNAGGDTLSGGVGNDNLYGGDGDDALEGGSGSDLIDGGAGNDSLSGGLGNDTYITDGGDTITELLSAGTDTVRSSVSHTLGTNLENLVLTGSAAINGTGNTLNNLITGNGSVNTLNGGIGTDTLNGGLGNDRLVGGVGNDIYVVNGGDTIVEAVAAGTDTVQSTVAYTLGLNLEILTLTGSGAINGSGNTFNNVITGNAAANTLNGATGADRLSGGLGNDTYITDGGDTITEALTAGTDTVRSSVSYTLGVNLENLTLTLAAAINGTGNALNNVIIGNAAANTLNGGIGNDTLNGGTGNDRLVGGAGNDIYVINGGDTIVEAAAEGTDTVQSTVAYTLGLNFEYLTLTGSGVINGTGNTLNNVITGNGAANTLNGGIGNDRITGGLGKDTLVGGVGADTFVFNKISDSTTAATTWDIITDFTKGQDKIDLRSIDAFGPSTANDAFLWKGTAAFSSATAGEARFQKYDNAGTANDYTVVFLDNDADTAVEMAFRLNGLHNLAATDFLL